MRGLIAMLLAAAPLFASAQSDQAAAPMVELKVKPVLCVIDERMPRCDIDFLVLWESDRSGYYCLFNDFVAAPLRCWSEEQMGELMEPRSVEQAFSYWMTGSDAGVELATVTVEVLRLDDGDRRRRRRTRHVWDLL